MPKSEMIKTEALILKTLPYSDSSLIVRFLSKDIGKHSFIAKGVRKSKKQSSISFEPFSLLELTIYHSESSDISTLKDSSLIEPFYHIRQSLDSIALASFIFEVLDKSVFPAYENTNIFNIAASYLYGLNASPAPVSWTIFNLLKILTILGMKPHIDSCIDCGKPRTAKKFNYEIIDGGIICSNCLHKRDTEHLSVSAHKSVVMISIDILEAISFCLNGDVKAGLEWKISPDLEKIIFDIILKKLTFHLDTDFQTKSFIDSVLK